MTGDAAGVGGSAPHDDPPAPPGDSSAPPGDPVPPRGDPATPGGGAVAPSDEPGPGGPFPGWGALYTTVVVWAGLWILFLYLLTVTLNLPVGGGP